jgi:hypothetical protein
MMDQTHIGYTYWQQPVKNVMPAVMYVEEKNIPSNATSPAIKTSSKNHKTVSTGKPKGYAFYEQDGYVSIGAEHYTRAITNTPVKWQTIPNLGRTGSAVTPFPVTTGAQTPSGNSPRLEYGVYLGDTGMIKVQVYLSPTLNYHNDGLRYAISIDDEIPQVINMHEGYSEKLWNQWVADNIIIKTSGHYIKNAGNHVLKFWMVDAGVVLQKIVIDAGGLKHSYLGPVETLIK